MVQTSPRTKSRPKLTSRFEAALVYATIAHADQTRKGTDIPYVCHLLTVAAIVLEHGGDEDEAIAALLHDVVEDAGGRPRLDDVREKFGSRVAEIVEGCTDAEVSPKPPWRKRKEDYLDHLRAETNKSTVLVSASDKLANVRTILSDYREISEMLWARFNGGREGTLWYYRALADTIATKVTSPLARELTRAVSELETLVQESR